MSTKFFNNELGNTLFDKLKGIASEMTSFESFLAVVGFFRSSGYFKLRKELCDIAEIKILVGINIDDIFRKHNKATLMLADADKAKEIYNDDFRNDIVSAHYSPEVEEGILQMCDDLVSGRLQMRIHATKNLHAKFYLCLPKNHSPHSDGWVIMGSSDQVEDDFSLQLPDGVIDLKYQKDAVIQGYQMLMQHNGLFLADVVGLGKTMIATMIAKRFVEANGKNTNILVVYPPALDDNWKNTFKLFGIKNKTQFITNGSLYKILEGRDQYKSKVSSNISTQEMADYIDSDRENLKGKKLS